MLAAVATVTRGAEARGAPAAPEWEWGLKRAKLWLLLAETRCLALFPLVALPALLARAALRRCLRPSTGAFTHTWLTQSKKKEGRKREGEKNIRAKGG